LARRGGYRALELRAATSLSRLLAQRGDPEEARRILGDIYGWFTEGFETADLRDAKALLDARWACFGECDVVTVPSLLSAGARKAVSPKFVGFGVDRNAVVSTSLTSLA
jgi:hypothetical protein